MRLPCYNIIAKADSNPGSRGERLKILIAEDDNSLRRVLVSILQKNNYSVDAVDNGGDAFDYLVSGAYDGAIFDVMMPVMDGVTALAKARKMRNATPVLLLTAKSEIEDKVDGLDAGANDYLTKPFDMRELLARVRALTRKGPAQSSRLSFGNVTLDTLSYELCAPGGSFRLANKEYQTMLLFMRNPGKIISSSQVLDNIWDPDSKAEDNTVWTYLSYLRRKLEALGADIGIRTVRGAGYVLEAKNEK